MRGTTIGIRIVYGQLDEQLNENSQLRDLVIECEELRVEGEEIAALCKIVKEITDPLPDSYTASYCVL